MRILIVEDDRDLNKIISKKLKAEGFTVESAYDGKEALDHLELLPYDLAVMDVMMPKADGLETIRHLRAEGNLTPVILLTARDTVQDKVDGLNIGANDYLVKPFSFDELIARIHAVTRTAAGNPGNTYFLADLTLDVKTHTVTRGGREIPLTAKEFSLLEYLLRNKNQVLSRQKIEDNVWDFDYGGGTNIVDVYDQISEKKDRRGLSGTADSYRPGSRVYSEGRRTGGEKLKIFARLRTEPGFLQQPYAFFYVLLRQRAESQHEKIPRSLLLIDPVIGNIIDLHSGGRRLFHQFPFRKRGLFHLNQHMQSGSVLDNPYPVSENGIQSFQHRLIMLSENRPHLIDMPGLFKGQSMCFLRKHPGYDFHILLQAGCDDDLFFHAAKAPGLVEIGRQRFPQLLAARPERIAKIVIILQPQKSVVKAPLPLAERKIPGIYAAVGKIISDLPAVFRKNRSGGRWFRLSRIVHKLQLRCEISRSSSIDLMLLSDRLICLSVRQQIPPDRDK